MIEIDKPLDWFDEMNLRYLRRKITESFEKLGKEIVASTVAGIKTGKSFEMFFDSMKRISNGAHPLS